MQTKINSIQLIKLPENVQSLKSATHSVILNTKDFDSKTQKILISFESKVFEINPLTMDANITIKERANSPLQNNLIPADTYRIKGHIVDPKTLRVSGSVLQEFLNKVENSQYQKADRMLNATDTIMGNYQEILEKWRKEQDDKSQISQIFFADLDVDPKEGNGPKKRVINAKDTAILNDSLYVVCKTKNMQGKKVKIYVRQGKKDGLEGINQNVQMFMNNSYSTSMEMTVGREASQNIYTNSEQLKDYAYGKIKLIPKEAIEGSTENLKKWKEILDKAQDKQTFLYIYAETMDDPSVFFDDSKNGDFLAVKSEQKQEDVNKKCFCGRKIEDNEFVEILKALRDSEEGTKNKYDLFTKETDIPKADRLIKVFNKNLNELFEKYEINTCIRKIHFLAQSYHETNRFRSSREEGDDKYLKKKDYYPFFGRGLMQLTWEGKKRTGRTGYKQYFDHLERDDYKKNYKEVDAKIELAFDSAGWFWERGKTLSNNKPGIWKAPKFGGDVGDAVAKEKAKVEKTIRKYGKNETTYGTLNLNILADNDWIDTISWLVNGGGNGFNERRSYLKDLKKIMKYEKCINNK